MDGLPIDPINLGAILVAIIGFITSIASNRSSSKTSRIVAATSGRLESEREAYQRARAMDVETIERQAEMIEGLRQENMRVHLENVEIKKQNNELKETQDQLTERIRKLERSIAKLEAEEE